MTVALVLFLAALALRSVGNASFVVPVIAAATVVVVARPAVEREELVRTAVVTAVGIAVFAVVRAATPAVPPSSTALGIVAGAAAGIGEEIFFRHALYNAVMRWGAFVAVVASATAFGLVHVPMYGWSVVPVDIAAGVLFGWQRWAANNVMAPALTHGSANVFGAM